jgi:hypothetical protein
MMPYGSGVRANFAAAADAETARADADALPSSELAERGSARLP